MRATDPENPTMRKPAAFAAVLGPSLFVAVLSLGLALVPLAWAAQLAGP